MKKIKIEQEKLDEILKLHKMWLEDKERGKRANLSDYDLGGADLSYADLSYADLSFADLNGADLEGANLSKADLFRADLRYTYLHDADLSDADLNYANLRGAKSIDANLSGAMLKYTDLSYAYLEGTNLSDTDLIGADLEGTNLEGANLSKANLDVSNCDYIKNYNICRISNVGSKKRGTVYDIDQDIVYCGCWKSNLEDFEKRIVDVYKNKNEQFYEEYKFVVEFFKMKKKFAEEKIDE